MKSDGGARGARELPALEPDTAGPETAGRRGWVPVDADLPPPAPGYRASEGCPLRMADGSIGYGHWRPAGAQTGGPYDGETWSAAWIDPYGRALDPQPTHWWAG